MLRAFTFLSCGRSILVVCQIWLLLVVLVVFAKFRAVLGTTVDFYLELEFIFGWRKLVSIRTRSFLLGENGFREIRKMLLAWRYCQK